MSVRHMADEPIAAHATPLSRNILVLAAVDEHQPSRINRTLLLYPAPACQRHVGNLPLGRPQAFFEGDLMTLEEALYRAAAAGNLSLSHCRDHLIQRQVRLVRDQRAPPTATCSRSAASRTPPCRESTLPI